MLPPGVRGEPHPCLSGFWWHSWVCGHIPPTSASVATWPSPVVGQNSVCWENTFDSRTVPLLKVLTFAAQGSGHEDVGISIWGGGHCSAHYTCLLGGIIACF